jgi:uncharacterized protein
MYQRVHVHGLMVDPIKEMPILVLKGDEDGRILPIWIGHFEANAIALHLEGIHVPRPMTHDLLGLVLDQAGYTVQRVLIRDLVDHTYFADLVLRSEGGEVTVDARPSDAVALAIRKGAEIFVEESLYAKADTVTDASMEEGSVHQWLDMLRPEDMGEYEM